jgi:predicted PurR-regulated permease PerM
LTSGYGLSPMTAAALPARAIVRIVLIIVGVVLCLYLIYRLRQPLTWLFISIFLAVALSRPVNYLNRFMRRGFAILLVFLGMFSVVVLLGLLLIPPVVSEVNQLADNAPAYAQDVREFVNRNETLRELEEDYDITQKLQDEAAKLPGRLGGAAGVLRDVGFGLVNRIFAAITILVLTAFLLGSGRNWVQAALSMQPPERAEHLERVLRDMARAVSGYVNGALLISFIDGLMAFVVLTILGVPFAAPLAVVMGFMSLIPLVGATIGAVIVGIVTAFNDFPVDTIIWTIYAIAYQQFENTVVQPQVQRRTVQVHPFVVLVSVLFGATLLGILGALVAIPIAASIQILVRYWWAWRVEQRDTKEAQLPLPGAQPG